jgi:energy-coupling factor transporter ATP-binding protein EcfA2
METEAPVTWPVGTGELRAGAQYRAGAALVGSVHPGDLPTSGVSLSERLTALARLVQIGSARVGPEGFTVGPLADAEALLARAGERLRLSSQHTIVVLAGGTGSGKSSLFNQLAGAQYSPAGVLRPATREPHACVWGVEGAGPLLDWLGIEPRRRYARSSALEEGERALTGLLLVDLPDHDSVTSGSAEVSRLVAQADLMVWVLDPQKYADAAVHSRYLVPMAGHSSVIAATLNQADLLSPEQVQDCVSDLRRLLDAEGLHDARVLVTSATSAAGVADMRRALIETVIVRQAALRRISADVDTVSARFVPYAGDAESRARVRSAVPWATALEPAASARPQPGTPAEPEGGPEANGGLVATPGGPGGVGNTEGGMEQAASDLDGRAVPIAAGDALAAAFCAAAGVNGVGQALQSARELKAVDYVGWPVAWIADRVAGRDPVRKVRLGTLWDELRAVSAGATGAQRAEISNAITTLADEAGHGLPGPWQASVRQTARSRTEEIPGALGAAIAQSLPQENTVAPWWRAVAAWQGLLLGAAAVGVAWLLTIIILGAFGLAPHATPLVRDVSLLPWVTLMVAAILLLGWLTANGCMALVIRAADQEREQAQQRMRTAIADVAQRFVLVPVERELAEFARFYDELKVARATS